MSPADARASLVADQIRRDWAAVESNLARARAAIPIVGPRDAAYVAVAIDHAYQAFETMLVRIEAELGLPVRSGASWHIAILADAARDLPGVRPRIISPASVADWNVLRAFRHFFRHAYDVELETDLLTSHVECLGRAVHACAPLVADVAAAIGVGGH